MQHDFLTTSEAADALGVTPQRVTQLIADGFLDAAKVGRSWIIDYSSVARRVESGSRGGRPAAGQGRAETKFVLMNRTHEVAEVVYNCEHGDFTHILDIRDGSRAPVGVFSQRRLANNTASFNRWWRGRGIPDTRDHVRRLLDASGVTVPEELLMRNLGLSLSDQYWIRPSSSDVRWEDVNFFNNDFSSVSQATRVLSPIETSAEAHPDNTSDGNLAKHWTIIDGVPTLLKEGGRLNQEPFNEVVATALHSRVLSAAEFVPYRLVDDDAEAKSACPVFLSDEEEYIPALYVDTVLPKRNDLNDYQHYVACCRELGVEDVESSLWKMMVCDDIIANADRHYRNFGLIRNVNTFACRPAPIFDSGASLWLHVTLDDLERGEFSFQSKQFDPSPARQLLLVEDMTWLDADALDGFVDEAMEILSANHLLEERLPFIRRSLQHRVDRIVDIREWS